MSDDWPYIREQFRIEFGVEMETRYGGDIMNLMMSIRELLKKGSQATSEAAAQPKDEEEPWYERERARNADLNSRNGY